MQTKDQQFQTIRIKRGEQSRLRLKKWLRVKRNGGNKKSSVWKPAKKDITPAEIQQVVDEHNRNRSWWSRLVYFIKKILKR